jgi:hypothetical protein
VEEPLDSDESEVWAALNEVLETGHEGVSSLEACGPKDDDWSTSVGGSTTVNIELDGFHPN